MPTILNFYNEANVIETAYQMMAEKVTKSKEIIFNEGASTPFIYIVRRGKIQLSKTLKFESRS